MIVRGVELVLLTSPVGLQLTDAPCWYSLRARIEGELCPSCDLGLPMVCACPPSEPITPGMITIDTRGLL